jgi:hypothetical protein
MAGFQTSTEGANPVLRGAGTDGRRRLLRARRGDEVDQRSRMRLWFRTGGADHKEDRMLRVTAAGSGNAGAEKAAVQETPTQIAAVLATVSPT